MEGNSTCSVPTCSLQKEGCREQPSLNVCQAQHGGSRTASQEYTVYNLIGKENMGLKKTHSPRSLNRKTMADGGRTTHEHPFPWEEAFPRKETMEYLLT